MLAGIDSSPTTVVNCNRTRYMTPYEKTSNIVISHPVMMEMRQNGVTKLSSVSYPKVLATRKLAGFKLPNHEQLIAQGKSATTTLSASDTKLLAQSPASIYMVRNTSAVGGAFIETTIKDGLVQYVTKSRQFEPVNKALQTASSKFYGLYETGPKTDLGVIVAELGETVAMLRSPFKQLVKRVKTRYRDLEWSRWRTLRHPKLKRLPIQRRRDFARQLWHEQYLQTYFGFLPFMSSIEDAIEDLIESTWSPRLIQVKVEGSSQSDFLEPQPEPGFNGASCRASVHVYNHTSARIRGAYSAVLNSGADVYSTDRFDSKDLLPGLWEAFPYSWLVDYVFNVGHVLSAEVSADGLEWAWLSQTIRRIQTQRVSASWYLPKADKYDLIVQPRPGYLLLERKSIERSPMLGIPPPAFGFRHEPQTRLTALAAVASVAALRIDSFREVRRFNALLDAL